MSYYTIIQDYTPKVSEPVEQTEVEEQDKE
jgi:hypothetical protein